MEKKLVSDYMTHAVVTIDVGDTVADVIRLIKTTHHDGFPVTRDGRIAGYISARDIIGEVPSGRVEKKMSRYPITVTPDVTVTEAARRIFRTGLQKMPVIDAENRVLGIITNIDVIRSQIERVTPEKVFNFQKALKSLYDVESSLSRDKVPVAVVHPTQSSVNQEELEGRMYELENALAEPVIVVKTGDRYILVDGHHRAVAADRMKLELLDAYVVTLEKDIELGLEKTARTMGIHTLADVKIDKSEERAIVQATHPGLITAENKKVSEYMATAVSSLDAHQTVKDVIQMIRDTKHDGFPVLMRGKVVGLIAARDIIEASAMDPIAPLMRPVIMKAAPDESMTAVARKMFRFCIEKLPVVDAAGMFVGLVTNADILRSQIERVTPEKVFKYISTLKSLYNIEPHLSRGEVNIRNLQPTQDKVYMDELESRTYEIKQGLAEPLIVLRRNSKQILIDGHHRAVAANRIGEYNLDAYIIDISLDEEIGIEKTARSMRLWTVDDIQILNESRHSIIG